MRRLKRVHSAHLNEATFYNHHVLLFGLLLPLPLPVLLGSQQFLYMNHAHVAFVVFRFRVPSTVIILLIITLYRFHCYLIVVLLLLLRLVLLLLLCSRVADIVATAAATTTPAAAAAAAATAARDRGSVLLASTFCLATKYI